MSIATARVFNIYHFHVLLPKSLLGKPHLSPYPPANDMLPSLGGCFVHASQGEAAAIPPALPHVYMLLRALLGNLLMPKGQLSQPHLPTPCTSYTPASLIGCLINA